MESGESGDCMSKPKDDLISRAAALDAIDGIKPIYEKQLAMKALCWAAVKTIQPVDVEPVVHSSWHWTQDGYVYCENCKYPLAKTKVNIDGEERHLYLTTNYCAHCGARMDGENENG